MMNYKVNVCMLDVSLDEKLLERAQKKLSGKILDAALNKAASRALTGLKNEIAEVTSRDYYLDKSVIKKNLFTQISRSPGNGAAMKISASSRELALARYEISPRKRPDTRMHGLYAGVKRQGGLKLISRGFLLKDNLAWIRTGRGGKWENIEPLTGPSIASIARNPDNLPEVVENAKKSFAKNFQHEVLYRLGVFKK